jgi:hypothetical protein
LHEQAAAEVLWLAAVFALASHSVQLLARARE